MAELVPQYDVMRRLKSLERIIEKGNSKAEDEQDFVALIEAHPDYVEPFHLDCVLDTARAGLRRRGCAKVESVLADVETIPGNGHSLVNDAVLESALQTLRELEPDQKVEELLQEIRLARCSKIEGPVGDYLRRQRLAKMEGGR